MLNLNITGNGNRSVERKWRCFLSWNLNHSDVPRVILLLIVAVLPLVGVVRPLIFTPSWRAPGRRSSGERPHRRWRPRWTTETAPGRRSYVFGSRTASTAAVRLFGRTWAPARGPNAWGLRCRRQRLFLLWRSSSAKPHLVLLLLQKSVSCKARALEAWERASWRRIAGGIRRDFCNPKLNFLSISRRRYRFY